MSNMFRVNLRSVPPKLGAIREAYTRTGDPAVAEFAFRRQLARSDLDGQAFEVVLAVERDGQDIAEVLYCSRFDLALGHGRLSLDALMHVN